MIKILLLFSVLLLCERVKLNPLKPDENYNYYEDSYDDSDSGESDLNNESIVYLDDDSIEAETIKTQATIFYESIKEEGNFYI